MRLAKNRSSSGEIAWSFSATMNHDGLVFHATLDTVALKPEVLIGPCVAARTFESATGKSHAKCCTKASVERVMKPCLSTIAVAKDAGGGELLPRASAGSPTSGPEGATQTRPTAVGSTPSSVMTTPGPG